MRDPDRIPPILEELKKAWEKYSDLRLGQLVIILNDVYGPKTSADLFTVEDEMMLKKIKDFNAKKESNSD